MVLVVSMILFILFLILGGCNKLKDKEFYKYICQAFAWISLVFVIIYGVWFINVQIDLSYSAIQLSENYNSLIYKVESGQYDNKDTIAEIEKYNKAIRCGKEYQHDFWLGIYYPNIYDNFDIIEYNRLGK